MVCGVLWPLWQFLLKSPARGHPALWVPVALQCLITSSPDPAPAHIADTQAGHTDEFTLILVAL